jgi:hypothetical protein
VSCLIDSYDGAFVIGFSIAFLFENIDSLPTGIYSARTIALFKIFSPF